VTVAIVNNLGDVVRTMMIAQWILEKIIENVNQDVIILIGLSAGVYS